MEPAVRDAATAFAAERYPVADLVVVGGSAAMRRRPRSDVDLLVVGPAAMFDRGDEAAYTERWRGELFEVFAGTPDAFRRHRAAGAARFRPVSSFLLVDGAAVVDRGRSDGLIAETRALLAAGPDVPATELEARRYAVTNALDDLLDAEDRAERAVLAASLFVRLAEFALLAHGRWIGSGRWLLRRLDDLDPGLAAVLGAALADTDVEAFAALTEQVLAPFGGRLLDGYTRP